jgi:hypothetical protein
MMKIYWFLIVLILLGCNKNENISSSKFLKTTKYNTFPLIVIPNAGCPGCISEAEQILIEYKGEDFVNFLLCNVISIKQLKIKLGYDILDYSNVAIDSSNVLSKLDVSGFYPIILYSKDSLVEISPSNSKAVSDLINFLNEK